MKPSTAALLLGVMSFLLGALDQAPAAVSREGVFFVASWFLGLALLVGAIERRGVACAR